MVGCICLRLLTKYQKSLRLTRFLSWVPPEFDKTLDEKLAERNKKDPVVHARVDIGLYFPKPLPNEKMKQRHLLKQQKHGNKELSSAARRRILKISLDDVFTDWKKEEGPNHIQRIADHYGIYNDLFNYGYFTPYVIMNIAYESEEIYQIPVYHGNIIFPSQIVKPPLVSYESSQDDLWTLVLTNLDGHLLKYDAEYLHWFIGNIKGNDIASGDIICDYLQPFPFCGTGYHRLVFILYKQDNIIDYSKLQRKLPCYSLQERTFVTYDFYKEYQENLTPAGLSFFQSTYDHSLIDFFHQTLNMREPVFEYDHPPHEFIPQRMYAKRQPFNLYLDRYRDPKDIKKQVLLKRLKIITPFEEEPPHSKYPNIYKIKEYVPSWLRIEIWKERNRLGKYRDLHPYSSYPKTETVPLYRPHNS